MLGTIISILVSGFILGGLARWAVPGPDPMPVWLTIMIGFAGSIIGGGIVAAILGANKNVSDSDYFSVVMGSVIASILLVIAYRRFVQKRPITGPEAHQPPTRGLGLGSRARLPSGVNRQEMLRKLDELHDAGVLTDEEYVAKRKEVLREG